MPAEPLRLEASAERAEYQARAAHHMRAGLSERMEQLLLREVQSSKAIHMLLEASLQRAVLLARQETVAQEAQAIAVPLRLALPEEPLVRRVPPALHMLADL